MYTRNRTGKKHGLNLDNILKFRKTLLREPLISSYAYQIKLKRNTPNTPGGRHRPLVSNEPVRQVLAAFRGLFNLFSRTNLLVLGADFLFPQHAGFLRKQNATLTVSLKKPFPNQH
ncbi:hypothetical protein AVEN_209040-1 [Araneus ventricosus]|uniref:Uncharacterized protein n=1 Tax=Araneus ventricosus TaxID=182803 RepID=A0A4Y2KJP9_ARAVE|nr:hypothetical protein AVEN_209040-1 [Araneus ventricosus]